MPSFIHFGRDICNHIDLAESREWWLSNGVGGYAGGNIARTLTSRHHGLLFASQNESFERQLLMVKAEIKITIGTKSWYLYSNKWRDNVVAPKGFQYVESFHLEGRIPVWTFLLDGLRLEMRVWMEQGENATWIAINFKESTPTTTKVELLTRFMINQRAEYEQSALEHFSPKLIRKQRHLKIQYNKKDYLHIQTSHGKVEYEPTWVEHFYLPQEAELEADPTDNHLRVGKSTTELNEKQTWFAMRFATENIEEVSPGSSIAKIKSHEKTLISKAKSVHRIPMTPWLQQLILTANSFFIKTSLHFKGQNESIEIIVTGYPKAEVLIRTNLMAFSGLTLATGHTEKAKSLLEIFAHFIKGGLLPEKLPKAQGERLHYHSADSALWYISAWYHYFEKSHDIDAIKKVMPVLESIISAYHQGTFHGIKMAEDSLIEITSTEIALTWMNAASLDGVVTPRTGKPVELNALWYNALRMMAVFLAHLDQDQTAYLLLAEKVKTSFQKYIRKDGHLYDLLDGNELAQQHIRANQILALSLPWSLLEAEPAKILLEKTRQVLYTSYGLRSLAPNAKAYKGQYKGDACQRACQRHQGTAWTWLLAQFSLAEFNLYQDKKRAFEHLTPLLQHLEYAGLGSISEFFDGDIPHQPKGIASSAISVASILEVIWRIHR